ncbi:MAG TPA: hypothetical protein VFL96_07625 [Acidobacteriaceae bacterium]|jgi:hypothetical protein|nr:hypothetical protein [Acidobacteriaceae bacterium]
MNAPITVADAIAFISELLNLEPVEQRAAGTVIWAWVRKTGSEIVHVLGDPGSKPIVFVELSGLGSQQPEAVLHFAILGWCARSKVLCILGDHDGRHALMPRKVAEIEPGIPMMRQHGPGRIH